MPPLITVSQAPTLMDFTAAELRLDMIEHALDVNAVEDIVMMPEPIIRETAGPVRPS